MINYPRNNEIDSEAKANAAAIALNTNLNILIAPESIPLVGESNEKKTEKAATRSIDELLRQFTKNEREFETSAKATGKAKIKNINLNLIIDVNL